MLSTGLKSLGTLALSKQYSNAAFASPRPIMVQFPYFSHLPPVQWHHNAEFLHSSSSSAGQRALRPAYAISFLVVIKVGRRLPAVCCDSRWSAKLTAPPSLRPSLRNVNRFSKIVAVYWENWTERRRRFVWGTIVVLASSGLSRPGG